jgi:hypothetical protein
MRPKFNALLEFLIVDFLFDTSRSRNNQSSNNYNSSVDELVLINDPNVIVDIIRREGRNRSLDHSFEIALKEYFNQCYGNNRIYKCINDRQLNLISNFHFHEAIVDLIDVIYLFVQEEFEREEHFMAGRLFSYLYNKKLTSYHRNISEVLNNTNNKLKFSFLKSIYCEAKLYYPILYNNTTEYVSLSWLKDEDRNIESYKDDDADYEEDDEDFRRAWNDKLSGQLRTIWRDLDDGTIDSLIVKNYLELYNIDCDYTSKLMYHE